MLGILYTSSHLGNIVGGRERLFLACMSMISGEEDL
jgi:hypothetical protein